MAVYKCSTHNVWVDDDRDEGCPQCAAEGGDDADNPNPRKGGKGGKKKSAPPKPGKKTAARPRGSDAPRRGSWIFKGLLLLAGAGVLALPQVRGFLREQGYGEVADRVEEVSGSVEDIAGEVTDKAREATGQLDGADAAAPLPSPYDLPAVGRKLLTTNTGGHSGHVYAAARDRNEPRPVLVLLHPAGVDGAELFERMKPWADKYRFHIVAPTSERGPKTPETFISWESGKGKLLSDDEVHVLSCLDELTAGGGATMDGNHVLLLGFGGGSRAAVHLASHNPRFSHFGVLHAAPGLEGLGKRPLRGFFSAGKQDAVRPAADVRVVYERLRGLGYPVQMHEYEGAHVFSEAELAAVVHWWLGA